MRFVFWFVLAVAMGLVGAGLIVGSVGNACRVNDAASADAQQAKPNGGKEQPHTAAQNQAATAPHDNLISEVVSLLAAVQAQLEKPEPSENHPQWEKESWYGTFFCEIKATDVAIALFTYCLVMVGIFQILSSDWTLKEIERAHLFIFLMPGAQGVIVQEKTTLLGVAVVNPGRTHAHLLEIYGEFSGTEPSGKRAIYKTENGKRLKFDNIIPTTQDFTRFVTRPPGIEPFVSPFTSDHFFFGYARYRDIFGREHTNRFCSKILPSTRNFEVAGSGAYLKDD